MASVEDYLDELVSNNNAYWQMWKEKNHTFRGENNAQG